MKLIKSFSAVVLAVMVFSCCAAADNGVSVFLNSKELVFKNGSPYYDIDKGRVMVPIRDLAEALGASVGYDSATRTVSIKKTGYDIELIIESTAAKVNGASVTLDSPPVIVSSVTYVPLRFVSENLNLDVEWNSDTRQVTVTQLGSIALSMSKSEVESSFGAPNRMDTSEKGYSWYVYNADMSHFMMVGITDNTVVSYYLQSKNFLLPCGVRGGMTQDDAVTLMTSRGYAAEKKNGYTVFTGSDDTVYAYHDTDRAIYAVQVELPEYLNKSRVTEAVLTDFSREFLDFVNVERFKRGLTLLEWNDKLANVAKAHSDDMAAENYYGHIAKDGSSPHKRLENAGFSDFYSTEAIAKAFPNSFCAFSAFLAKSDYVDALAATYAYFGAGTAYNADSDGILYYTQILYVKK